MSDNKVTFKGVEYDVDSLSDKSKYFVNQLQDLNKQASQARAKLDQIEVAAKGFGDMLQEELEVETDDANE
jgi:hypothetical protein